MKRIFAGALTLLVASCSTAPAYAVDTIEVKSAEAPVACQAQGMLPMPCAFMFAIMQKMLGGGCGQGACPVKL